MSAGENLAPLGATRVIESPGKGRVLLVRRSQLEVARGPDKGKKLEIAAEAVTVGTGSSCDLRLEDEAVSSEHLVIEPREQGFVLRDLESTNGTFVNGLRVGSVFLPTNAEIELGQTRLSFRASTEELELPLSKRSRFGALLGHSESMRAVFSILERVASSDATLLIEGESGTGKDLAARAVHGASERSGDLFIAVDCGAIPSGLVESELFGHAKGAFTGAVSERIGPFEQAEGGTVFLDEIGELPIDLQPKLLRALETRQVTRVGENVPRPFDARLIAATNRHLAQEVEEGRFRQDLFFRLSVIRVRIPPLRARREEIPRLVSHFLGEFNRDPAHPLPESLTAALQSHRWPGNVRELRNVVERLAVLPDMSPEFYLDAAGAEPSSAPAGGNAAPLSEVDLDQPFHEGKRYWVERFEREYLSRLLDRCQGNVSELARVSGLSRQSCHRLLNRHGLA